MSRKPLLDLTGQMGLLLLWLLLIDRGLSISSLQSRLSPSVPEEFAAPLELQQKHFGLVDDYGIKPKMPNFRRRSQRKESEKLQRAHKSKRDEPNFEEYYYDDLL